MLREILFPLLVCLAAFVGFQILEGQRDTARAERDAAEYEASGLREAARISGEMIAARDAIDRNRTQELNDARTQIDTLRLDVAGGGQRLLVKAACSINTPDATAAAGVADAGAAELAADARSDYFTLRDQLALSKQMILGLQDYVSQVCLR
ncbi:prophage endopeptidase [Pseudomonas koreensis]|uniref:lysis system i-spanin subunit Rz n=1 Tax=Pseudomonas koreensis TaxID=198620 RepID=UPI00285A0B54|nr:lysis system i-spanin subunit Rz [Pseudomonas koreensis]MDR7053728.1 prophage endopeptidase [Pseudomonas koreensis]